MKILAGKRAVVTGGARGIGEAIARRFAAEGADIVIHYGASADRAESVRASLEEFGVSATALQADLAQIEAVENLADASLAALGGVDILVNNAGVFSDRSVFDIEAADWDRTQAINLRAPFLLSRRFGRVMADGDGGAIVNFASGSGLSPRPGYVVGADYAASKAGLIMLTKVLAIDLAPKVRVNAIVPGMIDSKSEGFSESTKKAFAERTPLERVGELDDIVPAVMFLVSDDAQFVTGEVLNVDGGLLLGRS